jgi:hypothetical protein
MAAVRLRLRLRGCAEMSISDAITPRVADALALAVAKRDELAAEVAGLALSEFLDPKVKAPRQKLEGELATVTAEVARLRLAQQQAETRDEQAAAEVEIAELNAGLAEFELAANARLAAAVALDKAAAELTEAWSRLRSASELVTAIVPQGCHLPRGYVLANMVQLAKSTLYRHAPINTPGDEKFAFPGAEAPTIATVYDPSSIPTAAAVIGDECAWLVRSIKNQIELTAKFRRGELREAS